MATDRYGGNLFVWEVGGPIGNALRPILQRRIIILGLPRDTLTKGLRRRAANYCTDTAMWTLVGFIVASVIGLAIALSAGRRGSIRRRDYPWMLDAVSQLHVAIVGTLAGFAFTGVVLVVTFAHDRPVPRRNFSRNGRRHVFGLVPVLGGECVLDPILAAREYEWRSRPTRSF